MDRDNWRFVILDWPGALRTSGMLTEELKWPVMSPPDGIVPLNWSFFPTHTQERVSGSKKINFSLIVPYHFCGQAGFASQRLSIAMFRPRNGINTFASFLEQKSIGDWIPKFRCVNTFNSCVPLQSGKNAFVSFPEKKRMLIPIFCEAGTGPWRRDREYCWLQFCFQIGS